MTDASIKFQGSKYEATKDLHAKDLAKLIRADVNAAVADGRVPTFNPDGGIIRYSVRFRWATHSPAIDIEVTNFGERKQERSYVQLDNGLYGPDWQTDPETGETFVSWMNPRCRKVDQVLEGILNAYQQDRSDIMTDYFCVRYYGNVSINETGPAGRATKATQAAWIAQCEASSADEAMLGEAKVARHEEAKEAPAARHLTLVC